MARERGHGSDFDDEGLSAALWPWLGARLEATGASASELEAALARGDGCGARVEGVRERIDALGWVIGCMAEALGGSTPSPRRMPEGLEWMLEALAGAARTRGLRWSVARVEADGPGVTRAQAWRCARALWWLARAHADVAPRVLAVGEGWTLEGEGEIDMAAIADLGLPGCVRRTARGWRWSEVVEDDLRPAPQRA
jgi:hypothetical protein